MSKEEEIRSNHGHVGFRGPHPPVDTRLESVRDWLKTRDPNETFNYAATGECMFAQYLQAQGWKFPCVGSVDANETEPVWSSSFYFPEPWRRVSRTMGMGSTIDWTWAAALVIVEEVIATPT